MENTEREREVMELGGTPSFKFFMHSVFLTIVILHHKIS